MINEERLKELIAEATVDCYDEEEEYWGMWTMLAAVLVNQNTSCV